MADEPSSSSAESSGASSSSEEAEAPSSSSSSQEEEEEEEAPSSSVSDEVAVLKRDAQRPLVDKRKRKQVKRLDPSPCLAAEEDRKHHSEDIDDDDERPRKSRAQAEDDYQLEEYVAWLGTMRRKRPPPPKTWDDLTRSKGWLWKTHGEELAEVRKGLGAENKVQAQSKAHWDWVLEKALAGAPKEQYQLQRIDMVKTRCVMCNGTKECTFSLNGGLLMGAACAKLMEAWITWCVILSTILYSADADPDHLRDMIALKMRKDTVVEYHAKKSTWNRKKSRKARSDEDDDQEEAAVIPNRIDDAWRAKWKSANDARRADREKK
jgi:hypothetical protein